MEEINAMKRIEGLANELEFNLYADLIFFKNIYNSYTFFWENTACFSQWYESNFELNEISFLTTEQYMMFQKAILFDDKTTAMAILNTKDPKKQKLLGRQVSNFDEVIWKKHSRKIVYEGNFGKFSQNKDLKEQLLETKGTLLVESSPYDKIWGIGLSKNDERVNDMKNWQGANWLGCVLTLLRDDFIKMGL